MKRITPILILASTSCLSANEALDILESNKAPTSPPVIESAPGKAFQGDVSFPEFVWPEWQTRNFDPIWNRSVLFKDQENPWVQEVAIRGMIESRASFGEADIERARNADMDSTRTRRARLGARIRAFGNTDIDAVGEFAGSSDYRGIERLTGRTELLPGMGFRYGKFRPNFTADYRMEAEQLPFPDHAMFASTIAPTSTLGFQFEYEVSNWDYSIGWFSSDYDPYFPSFEGDGILAFSLGNTSVTMEGNTPTRTRWHLDYLHNFDAAQSEQIRRYRVTQRSINGAQALENPAYRHLFSTGFTIEKENTGFMGDFMFAHGESKAWGLSLAPTWWAIPGWLQVVGRYHYAASDDPNGLVGRMGASSDPWFDNSPFFIGDEYHSFFLGGNFHLYRDKLILTGGMENVIFNDEAGDAADSFNTEAWIWHTGVKASF